MRHGEARLHIHVQTNAIRVECGYMQLVINQLVAGHATLPNYYGVYSAQDIYILNTIPQYYNECSLKEAIPT